MLLSAHTAHHVVVGAIGTGAITSALLYGAASAAAQPPAPAPLPNCSAADLAGVTSGVSAATSAYLFTRPDVNAFFTGLKGQPRDQQRANVQSYLDANPQVRADLRGIRQPLVDFKSRCQ